MSIISYTTTNFPSYSFGSLPTSNYVVSTNNCLYGTAALVTIGNHVKEKKRVTYVKYEDDYKEYIEKLNCKLKEHKLEVDKEYFSDKFMKSQKSLLNALAFAGTGHYFDTVADLVQWKIRDSKSKFDDETQLLFDFAKYNDFYESDNLHANISTILKIICKVKNLEIKILSGNTWITYSNTHESKRKILLAQDETEPNLFFLLDTYTEKPGTEVKEKEVKEKEVKENPFEKEKEKEVEKDKVKEQEPEYGFSVIEVTEVYDLK